jgi:hypothetical protein
VADQNSYRFTARLWVHPGEAGWHFLTVPVEISADIAERTTGARPSFGSVRVVAVVGGKNWRTSLFPDAQAGAYLLPVKKSIRAAAQLQADDVVEIELEVET